MKTVFLKVFFKGFPSALVVSPVIPSFYKTEITTNLDRLSYETDNTESYIPVNCIQKKHGDSVWHTIDGHEYLLPSMFISFYALGF